MSKLTRQADANKGLEAGMFYPTGYIVAGFADRQTRDRAQQALIRQGFGEAQLTAVTAQDMREQAASNLQAPSVFASMGSSLPARQKQLELAEAGCDFLLIEAPEREQEQRAVWALSQVPIRYAIKYRRLIIENLLPEIPSATDDAQPARVP